MSISLPKLNSPPSISIAKNFISQKNILSSPFTTTITQCVCVCFHYTHDSLVMCSQVRFVCPHVSFSAPFAILGHPRLLFIGRRKKTCGQTLILFYAHFFAQNFTQQHQQQQHHFAKLLLIHAHWLSCVNRVTVEVCFTNEIKMSFIFHSIWLLTLPTHTHTHTYVSDTTITWLVSFLVRIRTSDFFLLSNTLTLFHLSSQFSNNHKKYHKNYDHFPTSSSSPPPPLSRLSNSRMSKFNEWQKVCFENQKFFFFSPLFHACFDWCGCPRKFFLMSFGLNICPHTHTHTWFCCVFVNQLHKFRFALTLINVMNVIRT